MTLHRCLGSTSGVPVSLQTDLQGSEINPRCLPYTHGSQGTSAAAVCDLSIILSLLLFQTLYGSALGCNMCNSYLVEQCSQSHLTVSKQFLLLFTPVSFAETIQLNCKAGALLTAHLLNSP